MAEVCTQRADTPNIVSGFTLIELSIVLVIIGLIVGGVLVGQDLIRAAYVRAQISQIEKFNTAVNTFYGKFQALPGDMAPTVATAVGFASRGPDVCEGNGNGLLEGYVPGAGCLGIGNPGETTAFWSDLTYANGMNLNLVEGSFPQVVWQTSYPIGVVSQAGSAMGWCNSGPLALGNMVPPAKLGGGTYILTYSNNGSNFYALSGAAAGYISGSSCGAPPVETTVSLTVAQASAMDKKTDDGFPMSGNVVAMYLGGANAYSGPSWAGASSTVATPGSNSTCYDNGNSAGAPQAYSLAQNNGAGLNCALSFRMQGGD